MTIAQVAAACGRNNSTVSRWEVGRTALGTDDLDALAAVYGCTPGQLLAPPQSEDRGHIRDQASSIIERLHPGALRQWLALGETLAAGD